MNSPLAYTISRALCSTSWFIDRVTSLAPEKPHHHRRHARPEFAAAGIVVAPSVDAATEVAEGDALRRGAAAIVVGGGADIYSKIIDKAARLEITRVHVQPEGDTIFPGIDPAQWREAARQEYAAGPDDEAPFTILTYDRRDLRKTS